MTTRLDAIRQREQAATRTLNGLCDGSIRWAMRVPAEPDRDPDLVIGASLADIPALLAVVDVAAVAMDGDPSNEVGECYWCGEQVAGDPRPKAGGGTWPIGHAADCQWQAFRAALAPLLEPEP